MARRGRLGSFADRIGKRLPSGIAWRAFSIMRYLPRRMATGIIDINVTRSRSRQRVYGELRQRVEARSSVSTFACARERSGTMEHAPFRGMRQRNTATEDRIHQACPLQDNLFVVDGYRRRRESTATTSQARVGAVCVAYAGPEGDTQIFAMLSYLRNITIS